MPPISRLLVANRGEIARRVLRAARALGIETVAVYAADDRGAPHVREADRAFALGSGPPAETYRCVPRLLDAAAESGADALHPGYGFLSEDPLLATACLEAGLTWVGPPPAAMAAMAHKATAKDTVGAAGVPVLASVVVDDAAPREAAAEAVGFPLLVKASAGGGGRGMRLVREPGDLAEAVDAARREAAATFGSPEVFLERYVPSPRHIEVQVVADAHGALCHLFDRECSIQRRHQKLVEEAPATFVARELRERMWAHALSAARAVGYEGVGTVEFVVGDTGGVGAEDGADGLGFAFLEMNTRLQVEHGVTELVTGRDLVAIQLAVAGGEPLGFTQDEVAVRGHAVEVRVCAERPRDDHRPAPGTLAFAAWPTGPGIRVDAAVESGSAVPPAYDSLLAKVLAWGVTRERAVARLRQALVADLALDGADGLETNRDMLAATLTEDDFTAGRTSTDYLETHPEVVAAGPAATTVRRHAMAAAFCLDAARARRSVVPGAHGGWRNVGRAGHRDRFSVLGGEVSVGIARPAGSLVVAVEGPDDDAVLFGAQAGAAEISVRVAPGRRGRAGTVELTIGALTVLHRVRVHRDSVAVSSADGQVTFGIVDDDVAEGGSVAAYECRAPLPGSVTKVLVGVGQAVAEGEGLVVLEAMKMEHTLRAAASGQVAQVRAEAGGQVDAGDLLVVLEPPQ